MKLQQHLQILAIGIIQLLVAIIGLIIVPIALLFTGTLKNNLPKWAWFWGNDEDGLQSPSLDKDEHFTTPGSYLDRLYWLAIRNPACNFSRYIGYSQSDVISIETLREGEMDKSSMASIVHTKNGKSYPFIYIAKPLFNGYWLYFKYGWKNWMVGNANAKIIQFALYPQIRKQLN
jgi:hypothetical protein